MHVGVNKFYNDNKKEVVVLSWQILLLFEIFLLIIKKMDTLDLNAGTFKRVSNEVLTTG